MVHFANADVPLAGSADVDGEVGGEPVEDAGPCVGEGRVSADFAAAADLERLGDNIAELAAHLHAATYRLLVMLAEFDRRGGWGGGFRSCAHWSGCRS